MREQRGGSEERGGKGGEPRPETEGRRPWDRIRDRASNIPAAEWVVAGLSSVLTLVIIGFLVYEMATATGAPPRVEVEVVRVAPAGDGYVLEIRVHNHGDQTAKELAIDAELRADTGVVETASTTLDYVPGGGWRKAGVFFTRDPQRYRLAFVPKGYDLP